MFKVNIQNFFLRFLQKWPLILQKLSFLLKIFVKECKVFVKNWDTHFMCIWKRRVRNMLKKFSKNKFGVINCLAMLLVTVTANSACIWYFHQPEFPKEANGLRKNYND